MVVLYCNLHECIVHTCTWYIMKLLTIHITINPQAKGCDSFTLFIRLLKSKRVQYILTRIVLMVDQVSTYINYSVIK